MKRPFIRMCLYSGPSLIVTILLLLFFLNHSFSLFIGLGFIFSCITLITTIILVNSKGLTPPSNQEEIQNHQVVNNDLDLQKIDQKSNELTKQIQILCENIDNLSDISYDIVKGANIQAENVEKSTRAMMEVSDGIQHIAGNAANVSSKSTVTLEAVGKGSQAINTIIGQMESIRKKVDALSDVIINLSAYSKEIGNIVNTISDISNQTNLLALNAAIEAARAGEHGNGFSIVASEVRKLSEETNVSTTKIKDIVVSIQQSITKSVAYMNEGKTEVANGIEIVQHAKQAFSGIQDDIDQVSKLITDVSNAVTEISAGSDEVNQITEFTKKVQQGGVEKITALNGLIEEFKIKATRTLSLAEELKDELQKQEE